MRLVRFGGAMSFEGYIAGPDGEYDWIVKAPDIEFGEMMNLFDTDAEPLVTELRTQRVYEKTGTIGLEYDILRE